MKFMLAAAIVAATVIVASPALARGSHTGSTHSASSHHSSTHSSHRGRAAFGVKRDAHGRIARDPHAKEAFRKTHPCPSTGKTYGACPGWIVDHIHALKHGGTDDPSNMEWQTRAAAKEKTDGSEADGAVSSLHGNGERPTVVSRPFLAFAFQKTGCDGSRRRGERVNIRSRRESALRYVKAWGATPRRCGSTRSCRRSAVCRPLRQPASRRTC